MYYLFVVEDGHWMSCGQRLGYPTLEAAMHASLKFVDDALPRNNVRVMHHVATAYLFHDGTVSCRKE